MKKFKDYIKSERKETELLMRCIPATVVTLFAVSVICMNLLANKTLVQLDWIALDGGILVSWLSFMCMDVITKHFGPKASNKISVLAAGINLLTCFIFFVASAIPSNASDYSAFDGIFGGTWFILLGSTIAFLASAVINNVLNWSIGNDCVINDKELWDEIMGETPLKRWATPEEIAEWAYFLTMTNSFCTGQNILVDGGESINYNFVWKND